MRACETTDPGDPWLKSNVLRTHILLGEFEHALSTALKSAASPIHLACHALSTFGAEEFEDARDSAVQLYRQPGDGRFSLLLRRQHFLPYFRRAPAAAPLRKMAAKIDQLVGSG